MDLKKCYYLLLFISLNAVAQSTNGDYFGNKEKTLYFRADENSSTERIDGSPYINKVYLPAKVTGFDGLTPPMRYNAEKDEMEFLKDEEKYYVTKLDSLEINFFNKKYKFLQYQAKVGEEKGYLVVLANNPKEKYSLFRKEKIVLVPKKEAKSSYDEAKPAYYRTDETIFYIGFDGKIIYMPAKKKELLALVPNNTEAVEGYLKTNKPSFTNENDLIRLIQFMNTLK